MRGAAVYTLYLFGLLSRANLAIAPADVDPAYKSSTVANLFSNAALGTTRIICFGSEPECESPVSPNAAKFDLLFNFEFDSDQLTPNP
jgi:hypothetical protein